MRPQVRLVEKEDDIQVKVATLLRRYGVKGLLWWHTPNGGNRSFYTGQQLKQFGVRPGVPDILVLLPREPHALTAFLELKTARGVLSDHQKMFRDEARAAGCLWEMARSAAEAREILLGWGAITPERRSAFAITPPTLEARL